MYCCARRSIQTILGFGPHLDLMAETLEALDLTHVLYNPTSNTSLALALVTLSPILLMVYRRRPLCTNYMLTEHLGVFPGVLWRAHNRNSRRVNPEHVAGSAGLRGV